MKQLIVTTSNPFMMGASGKPLCDTDVYSGEIIESDIKGTRAYLHGELELKAGYDIPIFMKGNMAQLDQPINNQDILCVIHDKEYVCQAELQTKGDRGAYYITIKTHKP